MPDACSTHYGRRDAAVAGPDCAQAGKSLPMPLRSPRAVDFLRFTRNRFDAILTMTPIVRWALCCLSALGTHSRFSRDSSAPRWPPVMPCWPSRQSKPAIAAQAVESCSRRCAGREWPVAAWSGRDRGRRPGEQSGGGWRAVYWLNTSCPPNCKSLARRLDRHGRPIPWWLKPVGKTPWWSIRPRSPSKWCWIF